MPSPQPEVSIGSPQRCFRSRQLHFWVTDVDYEFISRIATENEQTLAATLRLMIRAARRARLEQELTQRKPPPKTSSTDLVPIR
jgi:hypothetical protein